MEEKRERKEKKRSKKRRRDEGADQDPHRQAAGGEGERRDENGKDKAQVRKTNFHKRSLISEIIATTSESKPEPESISSAETKEEKAEAAVAAITQIATSKTDFFSQLLAKEKRAPPVGTFHATGKKSDTPSGGADLSTDWLCPKCNTSNYRHSHQCQKCKAVKRMTTWR
jgi:hypothetical protein